MKDPAKDVTEWRICLITHKGLHNLHCEKKKRKSTRCMPYFLIS